jgi:hypothetical protein
MRWLCGISLASLGMGLVGCGSPQTETGYTPNHLKMNNSQIRALYAPEFSPEAAQNAKNEQNQTMHNMPQAGPGGF